MTPQDILVQCLHRFTDPANWTRYAKARNELGNSVEVSNVFARAFDLQGLVEHLTIDNLSARAATLSVLRRSVPAGHSLRTFNDSSEHRQILTFLSNLTGVPLRPVNPNLKRTK